MAGLSIHYDYLVSAQAGVQSVITTNSLTYASKPFPLESVKVRSLPRAREKIDGLPIIACAVAGAELFRGGTTAQDDIGYPCAVAIIAASNDEWNKYLEEFLAIRGRIIDYFINQRSKLTHQVASVQQAWNVEVIPEIIIDPNLFNANYYYSGLILRPIVRKARGIGKG